MVGSHLSWEVKREDVTDEGIGIECSKSSVQDPGTKNGPAVWLSRSR